ncbi:MAG: MBOAT family protein [Lachnospiraceae bacterium]|nr:MBOAT family protein [Lachnospiraceae bacterium]
MVFSNSVFLFVFLPLVVLGYYLIRHELRNYWLLAVSIVFYAWNEPSFTYILIASIIINYIGALLIDKLKFKKLMLFLTMAANLGVLFYFKYFNFAVDIFNRFFDRNLQFAEVILPIGISFFTFQGMSYVVDVYRQDVLAQTNPFKLGMYISMFPQLVAGPIVRYKDIAAEIESRKVDMEDLAYGVQRFIIGLFKKIIIADNMAVMADAIFKLDPILNSVPMAWLGIVSYTLQIFFDFAGYSDMAIGLGRMFGFHFLENFNYPYISKSITEFWRRWHMSLSTFFRDYVYIPLGGNRKHVYLNVAIVFLLTGIWHGAAFAFIFWGIWHGFFNIMEKLIKDVKKKKGVVEEENTKKDAKYYLISALQHIYTMAVVMVGWVFFRAPGMTHGFNYLKSMFGLHNPEVSAYNVWLYLNKWSLLIMILALFMCTPIFKKLYGVAKKKINENILIPIKYLVLLGALLLCVLQVASNTYSAFIYFQF